MLILLVTVNAKTNEKEKTMTTRGLLEKEIETRLRIMWDTIKNLPTTSFANEAEALKNIEDVGKQAAEIKVLRDASRLL